MTPTWAAWATWDTNPPWRRQWPGPPDDLDLTPKLAGFKFPALVMTGRYDMNVAPLTAWRLAHAIPGAKIVFFEKSGHLPAYEEPDKYITVLEDFLNGH